MPHRILRHFLNNPRVIQQMADSWPIRRAARFSVQTFYKATHKLESLNVNRVIPKRISSFLHDFRTEYRKSLKALEEKKK